MGEVKNERVVMKVNLGVAELIVAGLAVLISIGGSWVVTKESIARIEEVSESNKAIVERLDSSLRSQAGDIVLLKERDNQLLRSTESYKESMDGLREVLSELNTTLGRMDERMKNVEEGIKELKN